MGIKRGARRYVGCAGLAVLVAVVATSTWASAIVYRVAVGTNMLGGSGGGGMGCTRDSASGEYDCPVPDTYRITSWSSVSVTVDYQNSNPTQPALACYTAANSTGGGCGSFQPDYCVGANRGVCHFPVDTSLWAAHPTGFKWIKFQNLTSGVVIAGYTLSGPN